jgi:3-oxoacyl-[acyl-carrier protein] reductase
MLNCFIVGASGGIGKQLAPLLKNKYNIYELNSTVLNITDYQSVKDYFSGKKIDLLINLAAFNHDCQVHKINDANLHLVNKQLAVNINGTINLLSVVLPMMRESKFGRYIGFSSVVVDKPVFGTALYAASKSFNESIIKTAALENAKYGITVNAIQLGYFDAGLFHKIEPNLKKGILESIPCKRLGTIEEIENTINFIVQTPYLNGSIIRINGATSL